jgi:hypothetical protein
VLKTNLDIKKNNILEELLKSGILASTGPMLIFFCLNQADAHERISYEYICIGETDPNKYIWHRACRCKTFLASA